MSLTGPQISALIKLDADILIAMNARSSGIMTYVVTNILIWEHGYHGVTTAQVLRRLKVLERRKQVERVESGYAVQLCWRKVPA